MDRDGIVDLSPLVVDEDGLQCFTCNRDNSLVIRAACPHEPPAPAFEPSDGPRRAGPERAQGSVEFVAVAPLMALAALACGQALLLALTMVFSQVALDRAAAGASDEVASRSVPQPWRGRIELQRPDPPSPEQSRLVRVRMQVPSLVPGVTVPMHVTAAAELEDST